MSANSQGGSLLVGSALVALGAIMLASKGLFAKALYAQGLNYNDVGAIRSVLAVPGFLLVAVITQGPLTPREYLKKPRPVLLAAFAGLLCYYLGSLSNFYALTLIQANVERALLYSYPALVVALQAGLSRRWPSGTTLVALVITTLGVILVTGALDVGLSGEELEGIGFIFLCSFTIAIYFLVSATVTREVGSANFTAVAMTAAGTGFFIHYALAGQGWLAISMSAESALILLAMVVFATVLPLVFVAEGVRRVGASRGALISTLGPPATALMAYLLLGETMTPLQIVGTVTVIVGVGFLEVSKRRA